MSQDWYLTTDMYFDSAEADTLIAEAKDMFAEMLQFGSESENITIDGVSTTGIIQEITSRVLNNGISTNEKRLLLSLDETVSIGSVVTALNDTWLVIDYPDNSNKIHYTTRIRKCNLVPFRFKIGDVVHTVNGYYEKDVYISKYDYEAINLPDDIVMVTIPQTVDTLKITKGNEFYIYTDDWYERYIVRGISHVTDGLLVLRAEEQQSDMTPEEFYNLDPVSETNVGSVVVTPSTLSLNVGDTKTLTYAIYDKSGVLMPDETATWESSDTAVATVDNAGLVTSVAIGSCEIVAKSVTDNTIVGKCELEVLDSGGGWY